MLASTPRHARRHDKKPAQTTCTLCRRRHNVHYADAVVMPIWAWFSLDTAGLMVGMSA
jgi:hypothetical protein